MRRQILWCDAEANCARLDNTQAVIELMQNAKSACIDTIIVDVKPLSGEVLYFSKIAPRLSNTGDYQYPVDFDLLATMITEGHKAGIEIHAGINIFCEAHRQLGRGPAYKNRDWQIMSYETDRILELPNREQIRIEKIDPWDKTATPAIFTRKSGLMLNPEQDRIYITVCNDTIENAVSFANDDVIIPEDGCIVVLDSGTFLADLKQGDEIKWSTVPVMRVGEDSMIPSWGIFVNPTGQAREYELGIIKEIVGNYDIDGIVFDRMRYPNIYADFSKSSLDAFSKWVGLDKTVNPDDIFKFSDKPWLPIIHGRFFKQWLEWRSWQIHDFADTAVKLVKSIKPEIIAGIYVGSWYESYYDVGVNWGSRDYNPKYKWMTPDYHNTGFAELFDYICTGCYYPTVTRNEAKEKGISESGTVEAGCEMSIEAINGASNVYGSLYLRDYKNDPDLFKQAVEMSCSKTDGVMLFDLVYLEEYGWWSVLQDALN